MFQYFFFIYGWKGYQKFEKEDFESLWTSMFLKNVRFTVSHDFYMMHRIEKGET